MSYRIDYEKKSHAKQDLLCLLLGIGCIALGLMIQALAVPRTGQALEALAEDLKAGAPVGKTIETFCREIFYGLS